jgi:hypothetical protein
MINTRGSVSPHSKLVLPLLLVLACYADIPGNGPDNDLSNLDAGDGGQPGLFGGGTTGGGIAGDGGGIGPSDAALDARSDASAPGCEGSALGTTETRTRFAQLQVTAQDSCKQELQSRTCSASGWSDWSGTYEAESCTKATFRSCGATAHGASEKRQRYANELADNFALCGAEQQTRVCNDGTFGAWSGSAKFERCAINFLGTCNPISLDEGGCVAGTVCPLRLPPICVGTVGHACAANAECQSNVCAAGVCVSGKVPIGGSCDEAADCTTCTVAGAAAAAVCTAAKVCACGAGASCSANNQCAGTCAAMKCVDANTACDNDDDCNQSTSKCVKVNGGSGSTCLLKDGQPCTKNAQCDHVCRPVDRNEAFVQSECAPRGGNDSHCDENFDCAMSLVCRPELDQTLPANVGTHCQAPGARDEMCDEMADCAQLPLSSSCTANQCTPLPQAAGAACTQAQQCQSGLCVVPMGGMGGPGMDAMGTCQ